MRRGRRAIIVVGSAAIVAAGYVSAPKGAPAVDLGGAGQPGAGTASGAASGGAAGGVSGTFEGPVVTNARGDYQARITVTDGLVVAVDAVTAGTTAPESERINAQAIPELARRVLEAQDWDVDAYSGASFTSPAFLESVHGAFDDAGV
ncbi:FMN-binding protein [Demequina capsici]|uniref:FMN-binding protein n=1 Tax=Demequina capsici TaxID=3075620 RepID=A0AA96FA19_9MICO|nr:FMN-binding protein [Demequina sp. PMTSA13]WNM26319.1 FMN-binding protein [Demequina sp. PMTSA13]